MLWLEALVAAAVALVVYAYLGYPLAIGVAARLRPRPVRKPDVLSRPPRVSIVIVVHNEEDHIAKKLESCLESDYPPERLEVVVVSDGSTDATEAIVRDFSDRGRAVRLASLPGPRGKATGLNHAVACVTSEIVVLTDARQRLGREAVSELVRNFDDPEVGAVSGALQLASKAGTQASGVGAYWRYEKRIRRNESCYDSSVGATGALYAIRRELFRPLDPATILDDVAIPMRIVLEGRRVVFESRAEAFDALSEDSATEVKRKVRTLAGNFQLVRLMPELMSPRRNRLWWQFVSHKLTRLAAPWALVVILLGSIALASGTERVDFYRAATAGQALFYLLAMVGARTRATRADGVFRVVRLAQAFTLLNWASALALIDYVTGRARPDWKRAGDTETPIENESTGGI